MVKILCIKCLNDLCPLLITSRLLLVLLFEKLLDTHIVFYEIDEDASRFSYLFLINYYFTYYNSNFNNTQCISQIQLKHASRCYQEGYIFSSAKTCMKMLSRYPSINSEPRSHSGPESIYHIYFIQWVQIWILYVRSWSEFSMMWKYCDVPDHMCHLNT